MKKIILLFLVTQFSFSQKTLGNKITYKLINKSDEKRAKMVSAKYKKILMDISDIRRRLNFNLIYTKNKSVFYLEDVNFDVDESALAIAANIILPDEFFLKDTKQTCYYKDYHNTGDYYKIDQSSRNFKWELKNETKKILLVKKQLVTMILI